VDRFRYQSGLEGLLMCVEPLSSTPQHSLLRGSSVREASWKPDGGLSRWIVNEGHSAAAWSGGLWGSDVWTPRLGQESHMLNNVWAELWSPWSFEMPPPSSSSCRLYMLFSTVTNLLRQNYHYVFYFICLIVLRQNTALHRNLLSFLFFNDRFLWWVTQTQIITVNT